VWLSLGMRVEGMAGKEKVPRRTRLGEEDALAQLAWTSLPT
jgi:hypothetical protein